MLFGEVEHSLPNAALGLQDDLLANIRIHMDGISEYFLAGSTTIDVRMIEEIRTLFKRSLDKLFSLGIAQRIYTHTADGNDWHL